MAPDVLSEVGIGAHVGAELQAIMFSPHPEVRSAGQPRLRVPEVTSAMAAAGVEFTAQVYDGAQHAFFNDTNPSTYNPETAHDAWQRLLGFLEPALQAPAHQRQD